MGEAACSSCPGVARVGWVGPTCSSWAGVRWEGLACSSSPGSLA